MREKFNSKQAGQTLIEVVVAIALGTIIIVALVGLSSRATRNSNAAKVSEVASKYAQEGLEVVRQIKIQDWQLLNGPFGATKWSEIYNNSVNQEFVLVKMPDRGCTTEWCLDTTGLGVDRPSIAGVGMVRRVFVSDTFNADDCDLSGVTDTTGYSLELTGSEVKKVRVEVSWTDPIGNHSTIVQSCITKK